MPSRFCRLSSVPLVATFLMFAPPIHSNVARADRGALDSSKLECRRILLEQHLALARERRRAAAQLSIPFSEFRAYSTARNPGTAAYPLRPEIDARRLINEKDWARATSASSTAAEPWTFYSKQTYDDWEDAARWVAEGADGAAVSPDVLREIHRRAMKNHFFVGGENRRILAQDRAAGIPLEESLLKTRHVQRELTSRLGIDHATFRGAFRSEEVDLLPHRGSTALPDGSRAFSEEEFEQISRHPYMKIVEGPKRDPASGLIKAKAIYLEPAQVDSAVRETLRTLDEELVRAKTAEDVILAVNRMVYKMVGIHPFQDGNGRSVRLLADLVYERHGLPPPLYPNERDLEMGEMEALDFTLRGMEAYLEAHRRAR